MVQPCKIEGCEAPNRSKGYCSKHYTRLRRHGDPNHVERDLSHRKAGLTLEQKLDAYSEWEGQCLVWTNHLLRGYGRVVDKGRHWVAHRAAYSVHKGPIPEDHEIDHICGNRACINPDHLEAVTRSEHNRRETERRLLSWDTCKAGLHPYPENRTYEPYRS